MKKIIFIILIILILVFSLITINSCSESTTIKSGEEATNKVAEIGENIGEVSDEIEGINQDLG